MSNAKVSKQERRDAAREQARKLREAQQRREKRNRLLIIAGVVVFIAIVVAALVSIINSANRPPLEGVEKPAGAIESGAIQLGADGIGSVSEGAPVVDVYLDYLCTHCANFEAINEGVLEDLAANGEATVNYHPVAYIGGSDFNVRAANALAVVATDSPEHFAEFNNQLFVAQGEGGATPLSDDQIAEAGREVGVPGDVVETFTDGRFTEWVEGVTEQAQRDEIRGTPTILIDGEDFGGWQQPGALAEAVTGAA